MYGCCSCEWPGFWSTGASAKRTCTLPSAGSTSDGESVADCTRRLTLRFLPSSFTTAAQLPYLGQRSDALESSPAGISLSGPLGACLAEVKFEPPGCRLRSAVLAGGSVAMPGLRLVETLQPLSEPSSKLPLVKSGWAL